MRIVGGRLRGARLAAPGGNDVRPTSDKVRESVFNILAHGIDDFEIDGARVIDLFAGTGALGCEALSRGAAFCLFVDDAPSSRGAIRQNIESLALTGATRVFRRDATRLGPAGPIKPFDLLFTDPPYGKGLAERALRAAAEGGWLKPGAVCVVEERADAGFVPPEGFTLADERRYGDTAIHFLRHESQNVSQPD
ncbi:MAG: 16S rRNA (guanine(966)-N(2))-methyltransferase RsmD [Dichotomicrobium sp.]